ncbi:MAG: hypothetical protein NZM43_12795 [Saprospiraceae bacterium]|nr:hypothetical protein [Saprospiraceae bacterium]MDW8485191.1 hypothetical protein [Saprospiraceae bacterium]
MSGRCKSKSGAARQPLENALRVAVRLKTPAAQEADEHHARSLGYFNRQTRGRAYGGKEKVSGI